jgi:hypothetical protein
MWRSIPAVLLIVGVGCGSKVNQTSTLSVKPGEARMLIVEGPKKNQRVRVEISAASAPVNVFVILSKDESGMEREVAISKPKKPTSAINGDYNVKTWSGEADIPAGAEFMVWVQAVSRRYRDDQQPVNTR